MQGILFSHYAWGTNRLILDGLEFSIGLFDFDKSLTKYLNKIHKILVIP